jgi:hypothetical protein
MTDFCIKSMFNPSMDPANAHLRHAAMTGLGTAISSTGRGGADSMPAATPISQSGDRRSFGRCHDVRLLTF